MPARFDVFLSHASSDKPRVEELARRLTREGLRPWLDKWNLIPGTAWQPEIEAVLADCGTCAVIIGAGGFGPWHHEEMRTAINRRVEDREHAFRVIPVLLPDVERPERNRLPGFLTATTWVEFRDSLDDPAAFHRLLCGIRGIEPGDGAGGAAFEGKNPYRGLELFDIEHAPLFFGREALTEWLLDALKRKPSAVENRFLAIVGASGSGKSSLARAGLLAALKDGKLDGSAAWPRAICRPGAEPFFNLAKALTGLAAESVSAAVFDRLQGRKDGERSLHVGAGLVLGEPPRAERLVVLVDQFEEIFTLCNDEPERRDFIANLLHAATVASGRTIVVLTMRADFYPRCAAYADLAAALSSNHQVLVGPMTEDELRRAIDRPARLAGLEPEAGLVELLVDDIRGRAGALPLLQFALQEIWRRRDDYRLTIRTYREIGQIEGALQRKADAVYGNFTDEQKELCRRVFLRLIQPGEGSEDTRRRASLRELLPDDPTQAGAVQAIIDRLSDPESRLLTTERQQTASGERTLEVTHEALIRGWPQLRKWIETDRAGLRTQLRLTDAAKEWADAIPEAKEGALYAGARLAVASEWAASHRDDLSALELAFLSASQERERQIKADEAEKSRRLAEAEHARAEEAEARKRDAEVAVRRQKKLSQGILVAAALSLLLAGAAVWESTRAARATRTANTAAETAKKSAKLAEDKEAIAIAEKKNADIARKLADAQRDRALARQLAAKSLMRWSQPGCVGRELEKTILVAVESLRLYPTPEANQVVRRGLDLLPRLTTRYEVPNVQSLGMVGREGVLAAGWNGANFFEKNTKGRLWALDVLSGRRQEFEVASIRRGSLTIIASSLKTGHASVNSTTSVSAVAISHDGRRLAGAVIDGGINIWDAWGQTLLSNIPYKGSSAVKVALDREGRRVAIADVGQIVSEKGNGFSDAEGRGGLIQVWEVEGGKEVFRKDMLDVATSVALSGDGTRVAAGSASGIIHIWDLGTGELIGSYRHSSHETGMNMFPGIEELALDQGGRVLAAMGQDEGIRIWRIDSDREIVRAYHLAGNSLALNREGSVLASADNNRAAVIQLWDLTPKQGWCPKVIADRPTST